MIAKSVQELCKLLGIEHIRCTPYHSRGNPSVERVNQTIVTKLATYLEDNRLDQQKWTSILPMITYSINTTPHETTNFSPFELTYGFKPSLALDTLRSTTVTDTYIQGLKDRLTIINREALINTNEPIKQCINNTSTDPEANQSNVESQDNLRHWGQTKLSGDEKDIHQKDQTSQGRFMAKIRHTFQPSGGVGRLLRISANNSDNRIIAYADVATVIVWAKTQDALKRKIHRIMRRVMDWGESVKLNFGPDKTELMYYRQVKDKHRHLTSYQLSGDTAVTTTRQKLATRGNSDQPFTITIDGHMVTEKQYTRILGVYINNRLTWENHLDEAKQNAEKKWHMMATACANK